MQTTTKILSKFTKKITHVDNMMIHNLVKYLVQTRLRLWDTKITNFKPVILSIWFVRKLFFYISQTKLSLNKIFYKIVYHHIIYMCDYFGEFRWLFLPWFARVFTKVMVSTKHVAILKIQYIPLLQKWFLATPRIFLGTDQKGTRCYKWWLVTVATDPPLKMHL